MTAVAPLTPLPRPRALGAALAGVLDSHPYAASGAVHLGGARLMGDAAALWERLRALPPSALARAVEHLTPRELRVLSLTARGRFAEDGCLAVLAALLTRGDALPDGEMLAWAAWLFSDGVAAFAHHAAAYVRARQRCPALWRGMLAASPAAVAAHAFLGQRTAFDLWAGSASAAVDEHPRFLDHVRRRLLAPGDLAALDSRVPDGTIAAWAAALVHPDARDAWYAAFLSETVAARRQRSSAPWPASHAVCADVLARARTPADELPFWAGVAPDVQDAFALWYRDRELTELLGGENDRVDFWRRYLTSMRRMEANAEGSVVFIHFDGWFATQFVNTGRATFLFRAGQGRGWRFRREEDLYPLVRRLRHRGDPSFLSSYEHRGYAATWQAHASAEVATVRRRLAAEDLAARG